MIERTRVEPLVNRVVRVSVGDRPLSIGGVELDYTSTGARATVHQLDERPAMGTSASWSPTVPTWPWASGRTRGST